MSEFNRNVIQEFRANGGVVGGYLAGDPMMVLTVTGAKTGLPREVPLVYGFDGDRWLVIGSNGGQAEDPAWIRNLLANPRVRVEVGREAFDADAEVLGGDERQRAFGAMVAQTPRFADYQRSTSRALPVIALTRVP